MECLPDELFLLIFRFLHKFDILFAFNNLNRRFQRIVKPYQHTIDITQNNTSYKHFQFFLNHILPSQGGAVISLLLEGKKELFQLFRPHLSYLTNLQSITLQSNSISNDFVELLSKILRIHSLSELSISTLTNDIIKIISFSATPYLHTLMLHSSDNLSDFDFVGISPMLNLKNLSVHIKSVRTLKQFFNVMPNLQQLNLSMTDFQQLKHLDSSEVPANLSKLHLEFGFFDKHKLKPTLKKVYKLLEVFSENIKYLTLLVINADKEFSNFNEFQSLIKNFTQLETFQYFIQTNYEPDPRFPNIEHIHNSTSHTFYTLPKPEFLGTMFNRIVFPSEFNEQSFNCSTLCLQSCELSHTLFDLTDNIQLVNLRTIDFECLFHDGTPQLCEFITKLIGLSPNLNQLIIGSYDTPIIIQQLTKFIYLPNQITQFKLYMSFHSGIYHSTFFYDLSKILPNLKLLTFSCNKHFTDEYSSTLTSFIRNLKEYFTKLIYLEMNDLNNEKWIEDFIKDQDQKQNESYCYYTTEKSVIGIDRTSNIYIWL